MIQLEFKLKRRDAPLEEEVLIEFLQDGFGKKDLLVITKEEKIYHIEKGKLLDQKGNSNLFYHVNRITTHTYQFNVNKALLESVCFYNSSFKEPEFNYADRKIKESPLPLLPDSELRKAYETLIRTGEYLAKASRDKDRNQRDALLLSRKIEFILQEGRRCNR